MPAIKKVVKRRPKTGMAPGSLVFTGEQKMDHVALELLHYTEDKEVSIDFNTIDEALTFYKKIKEGVVWLNIEGLHDVTVVETIVNQLNIHRLTGEDILSIGQRPKLEEHQDYIHLVLRMLQMEEGSIVEEQVSFILKDRVLITFQENKGDVFNFVRKRIVEGKGQIRSRTTDYLLYALLDSIVDNYYVILEQFGDIIDELEVSLMDNPEKEVLHHLHHVRRQALNLRRSIYPMRELVSRFEKLDETFISSETKVYVRDLYDHTIQVIDNVETFREMASGMLDLYMNSLSNRMNNVMKVLTIIATIFIPLTFVAGVYGMNFTNMPELEWEWGYAIIMGLMTVIALGMVIYFRKKKWF